MACSGLWETTQEHAEQLVDFAVAVLACMLFYVNLDAQLRSNRNV